MRTLIAIALLVLFTGQASADHLMRNVNGVNQPTTAAEDAYLAQRESTNVLQTRKVRSKYRRRFQREALRRIAVLVPSWDNIETVKMVLGMWPAISASATADMTAAKDTISWLRATAVPKINGMTAAQLRNNVTVGDDDPFGDGTLWP